MSKDYHVGILTEPQPSDPEFTDKKGAFAWAIDYSARADMPPIGVWKFGHELIAIAYQGMLFDRPWVRNLSKGATS